MSTQQTPTPPFFWKGYKLKLICLDDTPPSDVIRDCFYSALLSQFSVGLNKTIYYTQSSKPPPKELGKNDFYISFYDVPPLLNRHSHRIDYLDFEGLGLTDFIDNQRYICYLKTSQFNQIPLNMLVYRDKQDIIFGMQDGKKLWILINLLSRDNSRIEYVFKALGLLNKKLLEQKPLTKEEMEKLQKQKAKQLIKGFIKRRLHNAERHLKDAVNHVESAHENYITYLEVLHEKKEQYEPLIEKWNNYKNYDLIGIIGKIPFIKSLEVQHNSFTVETLPLKMGCLNYGSYKININQSQSKPQIYYDVAKKVQHPYDFYGTHYSSGRSEGNFCFGGYDEIMLGAYRNLNFEGLLLCCLKVITNYQISTAMHKLDPFLNALNERKLTGILKQLAKEEGINLKGYTRTKISSFMDGKLRFIAQKYKKGVFEKQKEVVLNECLTLKY